MVLEPLLFSLAFPECHRILKPPFTGQTLANADAVIHALIFPAEAGNMVFFQRLLKHSAVVGIHGAVAVTPPEESGRIVYCHLLFNLDLPLKNVFDQL